MADNSPPAGTSPAANNGVKKEKGRVRFNSMVGGEPPRELPSPIDDNDEKQQRNLSPVRRPRPSLLRGSSYNSVLDADALTPQEPLSPAAVSAIAAHQRAQEVAANMLGSSHSAPSSRRASLDSEATVNSSGELIPRINLPLEEMDRDGQGAALERMNSVERRNHNAAAYDLVKFHTLSPDTLLETSEKLPLARVPGNNSPAGYASDFETSLHHGHPREGVLSHLLKLYRVPDGPMQGKTFSGYTTPGSSGTATPTRRKWYDQNKNASQDTLATLAKASAILANPNEKPRDNSNSPSPYGGKPPKRPKHNRTPSGKIKTLLGKNRMADEAKITIHVADILKRQEYIIKLCRALMLYGAPTHRLEEYLRMTARVLEIDCQFLYLPGCMLISFDDKATHTAEVRFVRLNQGLDLGKLKDIHEIYKEVLHDIVSLDDAIGRLDEINKGKTKFPVWVRIIAYGFASAFVGPFAFQARFIDMPVAFVLGCIVGFLQLAVAPRSDLYANVFEITASVITSFLARAFGSIQGGNTFCFSALAQSSIALILPGYLFLTAALELQSRAIVSGSIRMVHAMLYSLVLGFGITVGVTIYGAMDDNAVSSTTCSNQLNWRWNFFFVPLFALCLSVANQAKYKQMPVMVVVSVAGYTVNYFSGLRFKAAPKSATCWVLSLVIGILANSYSRIRHGVAAAFLLPSIFVQVPSGLAATGSILSGLSTANQITNSTQVVNGTLTVPVAQPNDLQNIVFNVAASMIQIAVGITVGLFLAALCIWPMGKRRSGLFTF
ncbi:uncharacterized protein PG986_000594 [Apiospora aurea]|uniref:Threonine/serine exporter-like N-terminal domain-containing protein n=1 Tax=Apiospora aurea TaxID=335848 RepID=A0ABR1QUY5_9PEZI